MTKALLGINRIDEKSNRSLKKVQMFTTKKDIKTTFYNLLFQLAFALLMNRTVTTIHRVKFKFAYLVISGICPIGYEGRAVTRHPSGSNHIPPPQEALKFPLIFPLAWECFCSVLVSVDGFASLRWRTNNRLSQL